MKGPVSLRHRGFLLFLRQVLPKSRGMRPLLALPTSLILALASQAEAVARLEMAGGTDLGIRRSSGADPLALDAGGHPVPRRAGPQCLAADLVADFLQPTPPAPAVRGTRAACGPGAVGRPDLKPTFFSPARIP